MRTIAQAALAGLLILGAATGGYAMKSKSLLVDTRPAPDYAALVPEAFGEWRLMPQIRLVVPVDEDSLEKRIYSQMVGRAYADRAGNMVMLLVAYGPRQSDRLQLHRPEVCYVAEGFRVSGLIPAKLDIGLGGAPLDVSKLVARREGRIERVTYWMRIGDHVVSTLFARQRTTMGYGLQGLIADGVLIRVSTVNKDESAAEELQGRFLRAFLQSLNPADLKHFLGDDAARPAVKAAAGA